VTSNTSWIHGNALVAQNPENLARNGRYGWGADILMLDGRGSWFHIPVPTPTVDEGESRHVERLFLLFESSADGKITSVHIWDGPVQVEQLNNLNLTGSHRGQVDSENMFILEEPHPSLFGMSISFYYQDSPISGGIFGPPQQSRLIVSAAGVSLLGQ
jgi:hypothetical protein